MTPLSSVDGRCEYDPRLIAVFPIGIPFTLHFRNKIDDCITFTAFIVDNVE